MIIYCGVGKNEAEGWKKTKERRLDLHSVYLSFSYTSYWWSEVWWCNVKHLPAIKGLSVKSVEHEETGGGEEQQEPGTMQLCPSVLYRGEKTKEPSDYLVIYIHTHTQTQPSKDWG